MNVAARAARSIRVCCGPSNSPGQQHHHDGHVVGRPAPQAFLQERVSSRLGLSIAAADAAAAAL